MDDDDSTAPPGCPEEGADGFLSPTHPKFFRFVGFCFILICFGGIMSGLQQAVTQISKAQLQSMKREGSIEEKKVAKLLEPLVKRRHLTLVCLLIGNALAMEALPVFMDVLVPKAMAVLLSVSAVVIFSEILPQAVCLKWPLELAAVFAWLVYLLIGVLYPIAAPIAFLLDSLFGEEHEQHFSKGGLRALAIEHGKIKTDGSSATLNKQELGVIVGALDLHKTKAIDVGTPLKQVFMVSSHDKLTDDLLFQILRSGHSRIPVFQGNNRSEICGLLLVKQLIRLDRTRVIKDLDLLRPILVAKSDVSLFDLFNRFCRGQSHMAVIVPSNEEIAMGEYQQQINGKDPEEAIRLCDPQQTIKSSTVSNVISIITLEDILEKMLQMDIKDETDDFTSVYDDLDSRLKQVSSLKGILSDTTMYSKYGAV